MRRVIQFPLTRIVLGLIANIAASAGAQALAHALHWPEPIPALVTTGAVLATYVLFVRFVERRQVAELAPEKGPPYFFSGVGVGVFLFALTMLLLWLFGIAHITHSEGWRSARAAIAPMIAVGFAEELLVRGFIFRIAEETLGSWIALSITALLFGVLHVFNPGATLVSTLSIALEAGVLLAAAYIYSRGLWLPIGLHIGWNFTEAGIFGAVISGHTSHGWWQSHFAGPALLSGGDFGPEASVVAVIVCLAAGVAFLWRAQKLGNFVKPFWLRSQ
jgi:membrane protease YdiL (CAAX protease family)